MRYPILWPYLLTRGVKSEGVRMYAVVYVALLVGVVVFWLWWASQPPAPVKPGYEIPLADMDGIPTPDMDGFQFYVVTPVGK